MATDATREEAQDSGTDEASKSEASPQFAAVGQFLNVVAWLGVADRHRIVRQALEHRTAAPYDVCKDFDALLTTVKAPGFRNASRITDPGQLAHVVGIAFERDRRA